MMAGDKANISDIFSSFQGEGFFAGRRQIFIRFAGCNLNCNYCDTPGSRSKQSRCKIEKKPGSGEFEEMENPVSLGDLQEIIYEMATPDLHSISLTGGEPLLQADFIRTLQSKTPLYLETNGTLPAEAEKVANRIKFAAVDIKLPEHECGDWEDVYQKELDTIDILKYKCFTFAKVIVSDSTDRELIERISRDLEEICPPIHLVLQPVTPRGGLRPPTVRDLMDLSEAVGRHLGNVQVLPQVHKMMGDRNWL